MIGAGERGAVGGLGLCPWPAGAECGFADAVEFDTAFSFSFPFSALLQQQATTDEKIPGISYTYRASNRLLCKSPLKVVSVRYGASSVRHTVQ